MLDLFDRLDDWVQAASEHHIAKERADSYDDPELTEARHREQHARSQARAALREFIKTECHTDDCSIERKP